MKREEAAILDAFGESFQGIDLLLKHGLIQPALVLLYSTLDAAAWLEAPEDDVTSGIFVAWADRYLLPDSGLLCTSLELYGARCGMVHSLSAFSKLSRNGRVRSISYAHGKASVDELNKMASLLEHENIIGVHVTDLRNALSTAVQSFLADASRDEARWSTITKRAGLLFSRLPTDAMQRALGGINKRMPNANL